MYVISECVCVCVNTLLSCRIHRAGRSFDGHRVRVAARVHVSNWVLLPTTGGIAVLWEADASFRIVYAVHRSCGGVRTGSQRLVTRSDDVVLREDNLEAEWLNFANSGEVKSV